MIIFEIILRMSKTFLIKDFEPKSNQSFLIDNNILMYLYSPIASYNERMQNSIGRFFDRCAALNVNLNITSHIISEFFHVNLNMYFDLWCRTNASNVSYNLKKDYKPTQDYKESVSAINASINSFLKLLTRFPDDFHNIQIENIYENCYKCEFTDSYLLELSRKKNWIIVSNDRDLIDHPNRVNDLIMP
jgi:rRNA-processing protein FCF1